MPKEQAPANAVGADARARLIGQLYVPLQCKITGERPWVKPAVIDLARAGAQYADLIETRRELKRERDAIACDREWNPTVDDVLDFDGVLTRPASRPNGRACWVYVRDFDGSDDCSYHTGGDPADWCEPCKRRAAIHARYMAEGRKIGGAYIRLRCALAALGRA